MDPQEEKLQEGGLFASLVNYFPSTRKSVRPSLNAYFQKEWKRAFQTVLEWPLEPHS